MKWFRDLTTSTRDGSASLTKIVALIAHGQLAIAVAWITLKRGEFNEGMWALYLGVAIGHAAYDKTAAMVANIKEKRIQSVERINSQITAPGELR